MPHHGSGYMLVYSLVQKDGTSGRAACCCGGDPFSSRRRCRWRRRRSGRSILCLHLLRLVLAQHVGQVELAGAVGGAHHGAGRHVREAHGLGNLLLGQRRGARGSKCAASAVRPCEKQ